jgi:hypothetical protein
VQANAKPPPPTTVGTPPPTAPTRLATSSSRISNPKMELVRACSVICIRSLGMRVMLRISGEIALGMCIRFRMCMRIRLRHRTRGRLRVDGDEGKGKVVFRIIIFILNHFLEYF